MTAAPVAPHLILIGLPGCGKTSVGRALATELGRPFLDFDEEIERREGRTVSRIFGESGADYFRGLEKRLTEEMRAAGGGMVLAPGGGWITIPGAVGTLRPPAAIIYLVARPQTLLRRIGTLRDRRPLLAGPDPLGALKRLHAERAQLYEGAADVVVDTEPLAVQGVMLRIKEWTSLFRGTSIKPGGY